MSPLYVTVNSQQNPDPRGESATFEMSQTNTTIQKMTVSEHFKDIITVLGLLPSYAGTTD